MKETSWTDITSYSRGDTERVPHSWELLVGRLRIVVTTLHGCVGYYLNCEPLFRHREVGKAATDSATAKSIALDLVQLELDKAREDIIRFRTTQP